MPFPFHGATVLTQSPAFLSKTPGEKATITCQASQGLSSKLHWYQQKPNQALKLLVTSVSQTMSRIPSHFRGSGSGTDFTLTIRGLEAEDAATYYPPTRPSQVYSSLLQGPCQGGRSTLLPKNPSAPQGLD
uniref:Ig-like domain-containing protein n=1 Tax=Sus scrofa TaxID=9823 RepID=A0A8D1ZDE6_PIG